ncbi:MAG TPA: hypothetical protein VD884_02450 [Ohtaekwangia sp.]|nr:hypothetical protein [Ohtaekwangia sp.]
MKKSIQFLLAAFVVTVAASCNKPAESTSDATDSVAVETPAPAIEEAPAADTTATETEADTTAVAE